MSGELQTLLESLQQIISEAKSVSLFGDKCVVEREGMQYIVDKILVCIPKDIKEAKEILEKRNFIIDEAKAQADSIIKNAEANAKKLIAKEEIIAQAQQEAKEILLNAQTKSGEIKKISTDFCDDSLKRAEEGLAVVLEEIKVTRRKFKGVK